MVGGYIESANGVPAAWIATWDGVKFKQMGSGFDGWVFALKIYNGQLYAGGQFSHSGATACAKIARWNGTDWEGVSGGVTAGGFEGVEALEVHNGSLYASGIFQKAGNVDVKNIASSDGASWHDAGWPSAGPGIELKTMASFNGDLYVAGGFPKTIAGSVSIARWNGSAWTAVGGGLNGYVYTLRPINGFLLAGGNFNDAGNHIAIWNGASWLGTWMNGAGMDNQVYSLYEFNGQLYVGGLFSNAGGTGVAKLARWNDDFTAFVLAFEAGC